MDPNDLKLPHLSLEKRLKDILNESPTKSMSFRQMVQSHNQKWPQYKSHEPSARSIGIRFKSAFIMWHNDITKEQMIKLDFAFPEELHRSYLAVTINPEWTDTKLIPGVCVMSDN